MYTSSSCRSWSLVVVIYVWSAVSAFTAKVKMLFFYNSRLSKLLRYYSQHEFPRTHVNMLHLAPLFARVGLQPFFRRTCKVVAPVAGRAEKRGRTTTRRARKHRRFIRTALSLRRSKGGGPRYCLVQKLASKYSASAPCTNVPTCSVFTVSPLDGYGSTAWHTMCEVSTAPSL